MNEPDTQTDLRPLGEAALRAELSLRFYRQEGR